jgi:adenosylhomocysteine nucleosidase
VTAAGVQVTGIVAALRSEARCVPQRRSGSQPGASGARVAVLASGMGCMRAARAAERLVREGVGALLCLGVAGALDPSLRCGDVVLASEVICAQPLALQLPGMRPTALPAHARVRTAEPWRSALATVLLRHGPVVERPLLTSAELICEAHEKMRLFRQTGAVAVDMESAAVGVVANLHGLPFMVLRVIADTAEDALPPVLRSIVGTDPSAPSWVSWLPLLAAPTAWPGLLRMGRRYQRALGVLRECAQLASSARALEPAS